MLVEGVLHLGRPLKYKKEDEEKACREALPLINTTRVCWHLPPGKQKGQWAIGTRSSIAVMHVTSLVEDEEKVEAAVVEEDEDEVVVDVETEAALAKAVLSVVSREHQIPMPDVNTYTFQK